MKMINSCLEEMKDLSCPICRERFPCPFALKVHGGEHMLPNVKQFTGDEKGEQWSSPNHLLSISFSCNICGETFPTRDTLTTHLAHHLVKHSCKSTKCQEILEFSPKDINSNIPKNIPKKETCTKSKQKSENRKRIENRIPKKQKREIKRPKDKVNKRTLDQIICPFCGNYFAGNGNGEDCAETIHSSNCQICGRSITNPSLSLNTDRIMRMRKCELCGEMFSESSFHLHFQAHFPKELRKKAVLITCKVCGRTFPGRDLYTRHSCRFPAA